MDKKSLSEASIITKYILPAVEQSGWDRDKQIAQEVSFTDGRIIVRKKVVTRGKRKRADIILYYKENLPLAIIEAKDNKQDSSKTSSGVVYERNSSSVIFEPDS